MSTEHSCCKKHMYTNIFHQLLLSDALDNNIRGQPH